MNFACLLINKRYLYRKNEIMERLDLKYFGIDEKLDRDGDCRVWTTANNTYLNKEEMQKVIDHLTELLKS